MKKCMLSFVKDFMKEHTTETHINTLWEKFETKCVELVEENIPSKQTSTCYSQPWINSEVKRMS
jgi:predicted transcriptional regulator YdeE